MYKVNLLPPELLHEPEGPSRKPVAPWSLLAAFCLLGLIYIGFALGTYFIKAQADHKQRLLAALEPKIQEVEVLQSKAARLRASLYAWQDLISSRRAYYTLINDFHLNLPVDMWLTRVEILGLEPQAQTQGAPNQPQSPPQATRVIIVGGTGSLASVGVYINRLSQLPYFKSVVLKEIKEIRTAGEERVTVFTIEAALKEGRLN
ncbi:MAG: PilN domain-containing protein [Bacillota bacterium]